MNVLRWLVIALLASYALARAYTLIFYDQPSEGRVADIILLTVFSAALYYVVMS